MTSADLRVASFAAYPEESRALAVQYLPVLRRLPMAVCPSFLQEIRGLPTSFPVERALLQARLEALAAMPAAKLQTVTTLLRDIRLPAALFGRDWVNEPAAFITEMTQYLWSSAQIDRFRQGTLQLFSLLPDSTGTSRRLVIVVLGKGVAETQQSSFGKLRHQGILLQQMNEPDLPAVLLSLLATQAATDPEPYAHWYVDGGKPWPMPNAASGITATSYAALQPVRLRVLQHMQTTLFDSDAGVEDMQHRLTALSSQALRADELTSDAVLQRFYTELFTQSSGPQVFSTSFVQWTARELMRRAQPRSMLLRYQPRQQHRTLNDMVTKVEAETSLDPEGSLRDAEMGAYYTWLETGRIASAKDIVFLVWQEGTQRLLVVGAFAPAGTETNTPMRLHEALKLFT
jgi:hypothetical protein